MALYPPLTTTQLGELNYIIDELHKRLDKITTQRFGGVQRPGDEDAFLGEVSSLRGTLASLDTTLFHLYGLVHKMKASNVKTFYDPPPTPRARPTIDALGDFL